MSELHQNCSTANSSSSHTAWCAVGWSERSSLYHVAVAKERETL